MQAFGAIEYFFFGFSIGIGLLVFSSLIGVSFLTLVPGVFIAVETLADFVSVFVLVVLIDDWDGVPLSAH